MDCNRLTYLRYFFGTVILILTIAGGVNFIADPANIFRQGRITPESYAQALLHSDYGLYNPDGMIDERLLAKVVASKSFNADCVVIGSSHVMQISSERKSKALQNLCGSILNIAVSGGGLEDHITLTYLALEKYRNGRPNKIILGVDPWIFAFEKNQAFTIYLDDYNLAKANIKNLSIEIDKQLIPFDKKIMLKLKNLINLEYTILSIKNIIKYCLHGDLEITHAPKLDYGIGGYDPIRLPDNSYVYSSSYISSRVGVPVLFGGNTYQTNGVLNQSDAISAYRDLLIWIKSKGVEPIFLMTPYHENVLKAPKSPNANALKTTEPIILNLAHELRIKVIGSYDPHVFGCLSNEFYDFMHPNVKCLDKLQQR